MIYFCSPRRRCAGSNGFSHCRMVFPGLMTGGSSAGSSSSSRTGCAGAMRHAVTGRTRLSTLVCAMEPSWRVQQDLRGAGTQGWQTSTADDRYDPSEGAPHCCQSFKKGSVPRRIGRTKGGLNSKLHVVCDGQGRPLIMLLSEGQMSDYKGAALMLPALPRAKELLGDKG